MCSKIGTYFLLLLLFQLSISHAQDAIYKIDGITVNGIIENIDEKYVHYTLLGSDKHKTLEKNEVALITSEKGNFAFMDGIIDTLSMNTTPYELLYLRSSEVIPVQKFELSSNNITYVHSSGETGSVNVKEVDVIVYTNNRIIPLSPMPDVIWSLIRMDKNIIPQNEPEPIVVATNSPSTTEATTVEAQETVVDTPSINLNQVPTPPVDREKFKEKALSKAKQFENYIVRIMDKNTSRIEANNIAKQVVPLFISDTSMVEVSNAITQEKVQHYLRGYLNHIIYLDYTRIEIKWVEINYVGNIIKGPGNKWYGTITYTQEFRGYKGEYLAYKDRTTKRITVVLKTYERIIDGEASSEWDVFLSNISVDHTS